MAGDLEGSAGMAAGLCAVALLAADAACPARGGLVERRSVWMRMSRVRHDVQPTAVKLSEVRRARWAGV